MCGGQEETAFQIPSEKEYNFQLTVDLCSVL